MSRRLLLGAPRVHIKVDPNDPIYVDWGACFDTCFEWLECFILVIIIMFICLPIVILAVIVFALL